MTPDQKQEAKNIFDLLSRELAGFIQKETQIIAKIEQISKQAARTQ